MKLRLLTLVVSLLTGISTNTISSNYEVVDVTPIESALYINTNFSNFIKSYNDNLKQNCQASYIEDFFEITIDTYNEKYMGYFLDFNDSNGHDEKEVYFDYSKFSGFGGIVLLNW